MSDRVNDIIVQGALGVLILFSVVTWAIVAIKWLEGIRARRQDARFHKALGNLNELPAPSLLDKHIGPTARVAQVAVAAWEANGVDATADQVSVPREILELNLRRQIQKERHTTEKGIAILASIGTTSPFIGLFGTVFGILHALTSISSAGNASLDVVAGPIGEALVATGVGIAVAVPAVLAFNYFVRKLKVQTANLDDYASALVAAALSGSLANGRPYHNLSGEHQIHQLNEARGTGSLREAAGV
jgi:biopolymer transport protein ExbB